MSHTNPYAAPQTLESTLDGASCPWRRSRRAGCCGASCPPFPTRELARLVRQSRALDDMQLLWMWLTPLLLLGVFLWLVSRIFDDGPRSTLSRWRSRPPFVSTGRLGHGRSHVGRYAALLVDAPIVAAASLA